MTFLQPLFLALMPLVLSPLVFFLLGPRIHREIPFSWVYLLAGEPHEGRRGRRAQDWFLVFLRMVILASLILAMSRPIWIGWRTHQIAVDATWSMTPHWPRICQALQEIEGKVQVVSLNLQIAPGIPDHPWGSLKNLPPTGSLWITDGQQMDSANVGGVIQLPRPCNRGVRLVDGPLAVLPNRPFTVTLWVYNTCDQDPVSLRIPEGKTDGRDTLRLTVEGCLEVEVLEEDRYPQDNRLNVCPPPRDPVSVAFFYDHPDTLLLARLLDVWGDLFQRAPASQASAWIVIGTPNLPFQDLAQHRGVWFSDSLPVDLPSGWFHIPYRPDAKNGPRFLGDADAVWQFYETLLGGGTLQIVEEGYRLHLPAGVRISPRPSHISLRGDSLEVMFQRSGVYRVEGLYPRLIVVQPPLSEVLVTPSENRSGRLPIPLTRPLILLALGLLVIEGVWVLSRS